MKIIITMPAYRAARTLENTYREIPRDCFDDVLVVDDASSDVYSGGCAFPRPEDETASRQPRKTTSATTLKLWKSSVKHARIG